jgi:hypothetical protein
MVDIRSAYNILVCESVGKRPLERSRNRWEDNTKVDLIEIEYENVN